MKKITIALLIALLSACTENERAKEFGGKETFSLPANEVLINLTWKGDNMWVLTEDTITHINHFREKSSFGVWEGEIIIKQTR